MSAMRHDMIWQYPRRQRGNVFLSFFLSCLIVVACASAARLITKAASSPAQVFHAAQEALFQVEFLFGVPVDAATKTKVKSHIQAHTLIQSSPVLDLAPGAATTLTIGYKNTGTTAWPLQTLHLRSSAKRESYLSHSSWLSGREAVTASSVTQPGEVAYLSFPIEAPRAEGRFRETFSLYYQGKKLAGTDASYVVSVKISPKQTEPIKPLAPSASPIVLESTRETGDVMEQPREQLIHAFKLIQSAPALSVQQGKSEQFTIGYKNSGIATWKKDASPPITLRSSAKKESYMRHASWINGSEIMRLPQDTKPGEIAYFSFPLEAPYGTGNYREMFYLSHGEVRVPQSEVVLPIAVVPVSATLASYQIQPQQQETTTTPQGGGEGVQTTQSVDTVPPARRGILDDLVEVEPLIRIGLFHSKDPMIITAQTSYEVRDGNQTPLVTLAPGVSSTVSFDGASKTFHLTTPQAQFQTTSFFSFQGVSTSATSTQELSTSFTLPQQEQDPIFEISSHQNRPGWNTTLNDNTFRHKLEIRYAEKTDRVWMINELPLEQYLKGIAETSNSSPYEYQKALIIAARTYAKYHVQRNTKYLGEYFTMRTTDADQVYRGYGAEVRLPNVSRAVNETRGVMVYYNNELAITPYYSQSDGRTRAWEEVWAGSPKPWLVSKPDPCCTNLPMLGHGVGMSARGGLSMALEGKTYEDILTYYYTGIELHRRY